MEIHFQFLMLSYFNIDFIHNYLNCMDINPIYKSKKSSLYTFIINFVSRIKYMRVMVFSLSPFPCLKKSAIRNVQCRSLIIPSTHQNAGSQYITGCASTGLGDRRDRDMLSLWSILSPSSLM